MSDKSPEEKDGLLELIKKVWLPVAGFLGAITLAYNFYQLWLGDQKTITYFTAGGGLIVLVIVLGWVGLSKKTVVNKKKTKHEPRYSTIYRRIALGLLGIVVIGSGVGGFLLYKNSMLQAEVIEKKIVIFVAQFDGPEETYGLRSQVMEELHKVAKENNEIVIIDGEEIVTSGQGSDYARGLGKKESADLVIWAWYKPIDNPNIHIHFENLSTTQIEILKSSETYQPQATLAELKSSEVQLKIGVEAKTLILFIAGVTSYKSGNYQEALNNFEPILAEENMSTYIDPFTLHYYIGNSYAGLGLYQRSIENYSLLLSLNQNSADAYNNRGASYSALEDYKNAIQDYSKVIDLDSSYIDAYYNRGLTYYYVQDFDLAIRDFNTAIELNPNDSGAYTSRGNIYYLVLQDYTRAVQDYDRSINLDMNNFLAFNNRGNVYFDQLVYDRAIQDYSKAIEIEPNFAEAHYNRGNVYVHQQDYNRAIQDYNKAIELDPNFSLAYNNRGISYYHLGDYEHAMQDCNKAIELSPNSAPAYNSRGNVYLALGKTAEAEADFAKYKELTGKDLP